VGAVAIVLLGLAGPVKPALADADACLQAIQAVEAGGDVPPGLLAAVARTESGRRGEAGAGVRPWPWTVNNGGHGRFFASKAEALDWVAGLRRDGRRNIDVGCMQVNLLHHPRAFASLEEAFDPRRNVAYGAGFLARLQRETGSWGRAVERYHSADPRRGKAYRAKVLGPWIGGTREALAPLLAAPGLLRPRAALAATPVAPCACAGPRLLRPRRS
jgi:hypothetical protein